MTGTLEKFLKYAKVNTESAYAPEKSPSTDVQRDLAKILADELRELGACDVYVSDSCCAYGRLPANEKGAPSIGFSSHIDTTPECSGRDVKPRIVKDYDGGDIVLNKEKNIVMSVKQFPDLKAYKGQDIVVSDGTTLLGADDKAGLAEIMSMAQYFHENSDAKHGEIQFFFPSDEEIGCVGAATLDKSHFSPDFAYTLDGGEIGEISYETFNAAEVKVAFHGINIHPGLAKNQMKNSIIVARDYMNMLPPAETPEHTEGREGYFHVLEFSGSVELTTLRCYIRDHDREKFEHRKKLMRDAAAYLNGMYGDGTVEVEISDTYSNIGDAITPRFEIVEAIWKSMEAVGAKPFYKAMRGGTDGTVLSFKGIPCPNICTGGHNFHGRFEYVPVQSMEKITDVLVNIVKSFA